MSDLKLLVKIPSRERKEKFFNVLNLAQRNRELTTTRFLITLDSNDPVMNSAMTQKTLGMWGNLKYVYGESKSKVDAINRDMDQAGDFDILLLLSDDMVPVTKSYDKIICEAFEKHFPDTDGVLWLNDGHVGKKLNTSVCMGRKYFERDNFIYNPAYKSLFCDNEFTDVSIRRQKVFYMEKVLIEHRHPMTVGPRIAPMDNLYRKNDVHYHADHKTYLHRKNNGLVAA